MNYPELENVKPIEDYKLILFYKGISERIFDVNPYIKGDWYSELRDKEYFKSVKVVGSTVEWEGGQDIAPHELYELSVG